MKTESENRCTASIGSRKSKVKTESEQRPKITPTGRTEPSRPQPTQCHTSIESRLSLSLSAWLEFRKHLNNKIYIELESFTIRAICSIPTLR